MFEKIVLRVSFWSVVRIFGTIFCTNFCLIGCVKRVLPSPYWYLPSQKSFEYRRSFRTISLILLIISSVETLVFALDSHLSPLHHSRRNVCGIGKLISTSKFVSIPRANSFPLQIFFDLTRNIKLIRCSIFIVSILRRLSLIRVIFILQLSSNKWS